MSFVAAMYTFFTFAIVYAVGIFVMHANARKIARRSGLDGYVFPIVLWSASDFAAHLQGLFGHKYRNLGALWVAVWAARIGLIGAILAFALVPFARP